MLLTNRMVNDTKIEAHLCYVSSPIVDNVPGDHLYKIYRVLTPFTVWYVENGTDGIVTIWSQTLLW